MNTLLNIFSLLIFCGFLDFKIQTCALSNGETCGKAQVGRGTIFRGNFALHGAFPWVAILMNNEGIPYCGGTILSKNKVLTAAHCIHGKDDQYEYLPRDITVILGAHNLSISHEKGKSYVGVQSIAVHPDWNPSAESFDADIAMLTLTDDVCFGRYIQPICLIDPRSVVESISEGYSVGYGKSEDETKTHEDVLKFVKTPIQSSNEICFYTDHTLLKLSSTRTFCGGSRDGSGVCLGDSGNGLFVKHSQTYYLRGIVSASLWTDDNCDVHNYAIFTNVLKFRDWIKSKLHSSHEHIYNWSYLNNYNTRYPSTTMTSSTTRTTQRTTTTTIPIPISTYRPTPRSLTTTTSSTTTERQRTTGTTSNHTSPEYNAGINQGYYQTAHYNSNFFQPNAWTTKYIPNLKTETSTTTTTTTEEEEENEEEVSSTIRAPRTRITRSTAKYAAEDDY